MKHLVSVILVTCPDDRAEALAWAVVEAGVAACVNIVPQVNSVYRWQGRVKQTREALLVIKSPADNFDAVKEVVLRNHPYELPEILSVPVGRGHEPYLQWILNSSA